MNPEHPRDAEPAPSPLPSGPPEGDGAAALGLSVDAGPTRRKRPPRAASPLVRLKRRMTILDTPEEEAERRPLLENLLVGWTGSVVTHGLIVLLLILIVVLLPKEKERVAFDTSLGSAFGEEEGLERLGGFDEELVEPLELDPAALGADPLLSGVDPGMELTAERILADAVRPGPGGGRPGVGGGDFGVARFGEGLETIRGVEVKVGDPQFTLIWDTAADIDLHVIEPGGSHIYWAERQGDNGGELDVDDTDGLGPENVYWLDPDAPEGEKVKGQGPSGVYHWYVLYYGPPSGFGGRAVPTRWKARVKHLGEVSVFEGTLRRIGERSDVRSLRVGSAEDGGS
ncbi:YfaP family protein [Tautonia plasticadhaerens]|uniref:DUF2135 domain-containing protein n=1 Tax=Tautonia plasticadhaerens TaxID=2527974 RepID=A0A518HAY1_9BACT|nr:hypothetical protein [Tautonia plasticadhaerens]QDV37971.1 hypothetical protein ElP_59180 [Tautonia plasticadhaerens]